MQARNAPAVFERKNSSREIGRERAICSVPDSISRLKTLMAENTAKTIPKIRTDESPTSRAILEGSPNW
jgi:hypothetical protein